MPSYCIENWLLISLSTNTASTAAHHDFTEADHNADSASATECRMIPSVWNTLIQITSVVVCPGAEKFCDPEALSRALCPHLGGQLLCFCIHDAKWNSPEERQRHLLVHINNIMWRASTHKNWTHHCRTFTFRFLVQLSSSLLYIFHNPLLVNLNANRRSFKPQRPNDPLTWSFG